ncbi:hypothetical protein [Leadbetterella byssophila]|uniref:hypothetical protein n=1 Tax=Leadbetterella byssophila TaxID=316068 RepID=UPI0039A156BA
MKDPAFLFYAKDFYEGTRMMLPEERACYIDLLIYQHQNGIIPNDLKRMQLYCSGVELATLQATLQAKFEQTSEGWLNKKMQEVISDRKEYAKKQSESGKIGHFWRKIYFFFKKNDAAKLKKALHKDFIISNYEHFDFTNVATLQGSLKQRLSIYNIENANAIENEIENGNEDLKELLELLDVNTSSARAKKFVPPTVEEVAAYCQSRKNAVNPEQFVNFYNSKGWKVGGQPMANWQSAVITWEVRMKEKGLTSDKKQEPTSYNSERESLMKRRTA